MNIKPFPWTIEPYDSQVCGTFSTVSIYFWRLLKLCRLDFVEFTTPDKNRLDKSQQQSIVRKFYFQIQNVVVTLQSRNGR